VAGKCTAQMSGVDTNTSLGHFHQTFTVVSMVLWCGPFVESPGTEVRS
jgi:hypothetical protein